MLSPDGFVEEEFRFGADAAMGRIEEEFTDRFSEIGAAGFAGMDDRPAKPSQISDNFSRLGRLPASFRPL